MYSGTLEWGKTHVIENCDAYSETSDGQGTSVETNSDGNMYAFERMKCTKTAGPGVSAVVQRSSKDRKTLPSQLVVGDFVLFDAHDHDDDVEPIWLGRVMPNPKWNGQGVWVNDSGRNVKFNRVSV